MILKPFMLRRIKRDVENELTEKVEVLLYCPLTIRQKLLYMGLKRKIRVEELLQQERQTSSSSVSQSNAVASSLMNLVMQFRKVGTKEQSVFSPVQFNLGTVLSQHPQ